MHHFLSVCLSVRHQTKITRKKFISQEPFDLGSPNLPTKVKGHIGQGQRRILKKGRWAHNNVKLLH